MNSDNDRQDECGDASPRRAHVAKPGQDHGPSGRAGATGRQPRYDGEQMTKNALPASNFLKALSHEGRLLILCHLTSGEKSVTELEELLDNRQAAVSQQLARLRLEGLVIPRRDGKAIYYRLSDDRPLKILAVLHDMFCKQH